MAVTVKLSSLFNDQTLTASGVFASGYKLFTYAAGSSTKQATYTDNTGTSAQTNPIILNASGSPASPIWLAAGQTYKFVLALPTDTDPPASPVTVIDNVSGINDSSQTASQWVSSGVTPTYINATTFTLVGDQTTEFHVKRKAQFTVTAGTVYGEILTAVYGTLTTVTMTMDATQSLDSGLSAVNLSILRNDHLAVPGAVVIGGADSKITALNALASINGGPIGGPINYFVNGGCQIAQIAAATLSTTAQYGAVDNVMAWCSTGAVSAGTISQNTASGIGTTGNSFKLAGVTLTGSAVLSVRIRVESKDAVKLKNIASSVAALVSHDFGATVSYLIIVRKPTVADNYTSTTVISTSNLISVPTGISSATWLKFENIAMGDCSNGIEVEFQIACGAVTNKNFEFTEFQIARGATAVAIPLKDYAEELRRCKRHRQKIQWTGRIAATAVGQFLENGQNYPIEMFAAPTVTNFATGSISNATSPTFFADSALGGRGEATSAAAGDAFVLGRVELLTAYL